MELGGVATTLEPGDELLLRVDGLNEQYLTNGNRRPGANVFTDAVVSLPVAD